MRSYYQRAVPNQFVSIMTNPIAGLNEYLPATEIQEDQLSDCREVKPRKNNNIGFAPKTYSVGYFMSGVTNSEGIIKEVIPIVGQNNDTLQEYSFYALVYDPNNGWYIKRINYCQHSTIQQYKLNSTKQDGITDSCIFKTEKEYYYCFTTSVDKKLHCISFKDTGDEVVSIDLPFMPFYMAVHANRVFITSGNKLWCCRAGDIFSWYSGDYVDDYISAAQNMQNGTLTITNQPNTSRYITFTHIIQATPDTIGKVTIAGTDAIGHLQTEELNLLSGGRTISAKQYKTITSITQSGWTASGTADQIEIGVGPVGSKYIVSDSGYWTVENEYYLNGIEKIHDSLYLFGDSNIYIFQGTSADTFNLQQIYADIGLYSPDVNALKTHIVAENIIYFRFRDDIYAFDGYGKPVIISRPTIEQPNISGIDLSGIGWVLSADNEYLYLYNGRWITDAKCLYKYNFSSKTWWKYSGFGKDKIYLATEIKMFLIPSETRSYIINFISKNTETGYSFCFSMTTEVSPTAECPYLVTKSFNTLPSEQGTLTNIILQIQGTKNRTANIYLYYNNSIEPTSTFTLIKEFHDYKFTGDVEILDIPLPVSCIPRKHHYKLKIAIDSFSFPVFLYNIERRFRTIARSR